MIEVNIIATGSSGNCYVIKDGNKRIMIECGISIKEIRKRCDFNLSTLDMCLVSHEHKDHAKAIKDIMRIGVPVALSAGTLKHFDPNGSLYALLVEGLIWERSGWKILPFSTEHDAEEPLGFLIQSPSGAKILYATDTYFIKYRFVGVTHFLVECNYQERLLVENEELTNPIKNRIRTSHFELENVKAFFKAQDLSSAEKIYLIHLSNDNSDGDLFVEEIQKVTGKPVYLR